VGRSPGQLVLELLVAELLTQLGDAPCGCPRREEIAALSARISISNVATPKLCASAES
jgi:hypothetical protein